MDEAVVSWVVSATPSKQQKTAQVIVASDPAMKDVIYDSGAVADLDSRGTHLPISLSPMTRYYWTVTVTGDSGDTATSKVNWFETAKLDEPWTAKWVSPPWVHSGDDCIHPYIRKQFGLGKKITRARAYISGIGIYELHINGNRIGDEYLTPYCNTYDTWVQYQTFDITSALTQGANAVGVMLANGWAKGRFGTFGADNVTYTDRLSLICEIHATYDDGTTDVIGTDDSWLCKPSPILMDNIYDGVIYDATAEIPGWCQAGLDETGWENAKIITPHELGELTARLSPPVKIMEEIKPIALIKTPAGETVLDMGQNMVGWIRMRVNAPPKGTKITLSHGEILHKGNFFRENLRSAKQQFIYISSGKAQAVEPRFSFYGFRYVKIEGLDSVRLEDFTGCVMYSQMETIGHIETSNPDINRLFLNALWGQKGNFLDVPTDCPQRDERMGWTGDTQMFAGTAMFNMDAYAFYTKFMYDLCEEQKLCNGRVPGVVPLFMKERPPTNNFAAGAAAWSDCATVVPWEVYLHTGDASILKQQYQSMKDWVAWVTRECEKDGTGHLWTEGFQYGDWLALDGESETSSFGGTDTGYLASAYYYYSAQLVAKAADVLGFQDDVIGYGALSSNIKKAMLERYFTSEGKCKITTQTAHVVALQFGLAENPGLITADLKDILTKNGMKLSTGFIGTPYLCRTLSNNGDSRTAYELFLNKECPGWLYPVGMGATTIWERWNSVYPNGELSDLGMNSLNHYAYGSIAEWMYRNMCGINPVDDAPGFKKIVLKPEPDSRLQYAKGAVKTAMGLVECGWEYKADGKLCVTASIPFNTSATITLPDATLENVKGLEGAKAKQDGNNVCATLEPGQYNFCM